MRKRPHRLFALLSVGLLVSNACAVVARSDEPTEPIPGLGDTLRWVIPGAGLAATVALQDWKGSKQWLYSLGTSQITTELLKTVINVRRPYGGPSLRSWPSGHASITFAGSAFIQQRYGWRYALPAYAGAVYTGWSRVHLGRHRWDEVVGGAAVGMLSSYLFTTPYWEEPSVSLFYEGDTFGFQVNGNW